MSLSLSLQDNMPVHHSESLGQIIRIGSDLIANYSTD